MLGDELVVGGTTLRVIHTPGHAPGAVCLYAPELGVVLFRRDGWGRDEWASWAERLLRDQVAFVAPTTFRGEPMGRLVFMHPTTPDTIVAELMASLTA